MIISNNTRLGLLLLLAVVSACESSDNASSGRPPAPAHQVEVMATSYHPISHKQTVSGTLEAITSVRLYNEESGRITKLPYHEGDHINKDDVVITLDSSLVQAELDKAIAEHKQAQVDLQRLKKLVKKKLASDEVLARAQTALNVAAAEETLLQQRYLLTTIKAPFSGVITERHNEPGDAVPQHSHILSIIDHTSLHIKMQLSESWLPMVNQNDIVELTIDALGSTIHKANITRIHPTINPDTRKGIIEIKLQPLPDGAKAGQLARVKIKSTSQERLTIPSYAMHHDSIGTYVFVIDDNSKAKKTYVSKGLQFGNETEIVDGLFIDENIVVKGFTALRDGMTVEIVTQNNDTP